MDDALIALPSGLAVATGLALIGYAVVRWLGRSPSAREWATGSEESARTTLMMLPGGGAMLAAVGFLGLARVADALAPFVVVFLLLAVVPLFWAILRLPVPVALYPPWAREQRARVRARERSAKKSRGSR